MQLHVPPGGGIGRHAVLVTVAEEAVRVQVPSRALLKLKEIVIMAKVKKAPERESMARDIEQYRKVIAECAEKLGSIQIETKNGAFLEEMNDIRSTIQGILEYKCATHDATCNSLDWMRDNPNWYQGWDPDTDEYDNDEPEPHAAQDADDCREPDDGPEYAYISISYDGERIEEGVIAPEMMDIFFFDEKTGKYHDIADDGIRNYMIRYPLRVDGAREKAVEALFEHFKDEIDKKKKSLDAVAEACRMTLRIK